MIELYTGTPFTSLIVQIKHIKSSSSEKSKCKFTSLIVQIKPKDIEVKLKEVLVVYIPHSSDKTWNG